MQVCVWRGVRWGVQLCARALDRGDAQSINASIRLPMLCSRVGQGIRKGLQESRRDAGKQAVSVVKLVAGGIGVDVGLATGICCAIPTSNF
jgi:hypothetical protein